MESVIFNFSTPTVDVTASVASLPERTTVANAASLTTSSFVENADIMLAAIILIAVVSAAGTPKSIGSQVLLIFVRDTIPPSVFAITT